MDRYRYYRLILSVMLATNTINLLVKNFSFLTDSIDHRSEKKNFSSIKSNHRIKIFFSSKDHRSNRCFLQLIEYRYRSNRCFFRHRCPCMIVFNFASISIVGRMIVQQRHHTGIVQTSAGVAAISMLVHSHDSVNSSGKFNRIVGKTLKSVLCAFLWQPFQFQKNNFLVIKLIGED